MTESGRWDRPVSWWVVGGAILGFITLAAVLALAGPEARPVAGTLFTVFWALLLWAGLKSRPHEVVGLVLARKNTVTAGELAPWTVARIQVLVLTSVAIALAVGVAMGRLLHLTLRDMTALFALLAVPCAGLWWLLDRRRKSSRSLIAFVRQAVPWSSSPATGAWVRVRGKALAVQECTNPVDRSPCVGWCAVVSANGRLQVIADVGVFELDTVSGRVIVDPIEFGWVVRVREVRDEAALASLERIWRARIGNRTARKHYFQVIGHGTTVEVVGKAVAVPGPSGYREAPNRPAIVGGAGEPLVILEG